MDKFWDRLKEPTTYVGLPMAIVGIGTMFDWDEAGEAAGVVEQVIPSLAAGDWATGAMLAVGGILGIFMRERAS